MISKKLVVCITVLCALTFVAAESSLFRFFHEALDTNRDGFVTPAELVYYLKRMDSDMEIAEDRVRWLVSRIDQDDNGLWSWSEFRDAHQVLEEASTASNSVDPKQIHLSITGKPGQRVVMWVTDDNTATSVVQVGTSSGRYTQSYSGSTHTYTAGGWKGWIHEVLVDGLTADTTYHYRVGDTGSNTWSADYAFRTEPAAPRPVVFAAYGDMGTTIPAGFLVARQLNEDHEKYNFDLILHNGDLAYASTAVPAPHSVGAAAASHPVGDEWQWVWDLFCEQISPIARQVPYITGVGNHERFFDFAAFLNRFRMPAPWGAVNPNSSQGAKFWFSFDYGPVHFLLMSTEHDYCAGSEQHDWMVNDLTQAAANRQNVPWIIVTGHRPMYCADTGEWDQHRVGAQLQTCIEPLFQEFGVDMYLSGHMHIYERVHPVMNGTTAYNNTDTTHQVYYNPGMPVHAVQGSAGVFEDHSWVSPLPAWSAVRLSKFGYGRMTVYNATHLHYEMEHTDTRSVIDDFWIVKA